jgi:hypothetical protein
MHTDIQLQHHGMPSSQHTINFYPLQPNPVSNIPQSVMPPYGQGAAGNTHEVNHTYTEVSLRTHSCEGGMLTYRPQGHMYHQQQPPPAAAMQYHQQQPMGAQHQNHYQPFPLQQLQPQSQQYQQAPSYPAPRINYTPEYYLQWHNSLVKSLTNQMPSWISGELKNIAEHISVMVGNAPVARFAWLECTYPFTPPPDWTIRQHCQDAHDTSRTKCSTSCNTSRSCHPDCEYAVCGMPACVSIDQFPITLTGKP